MTDLSNWDFAEQFKAKEAAELIMGIPPESNTQLFYVSGEEAAYTARITPVLRRMKVAYECAVSTLNAAITVNFEDSAFGPTELQSELVMKIREAKSAPTDPRKKLELFLFEKAYFHRSEIKRWLDETGMTSVYQFNRSSERPSDVSSGRWPWGDHHTELLGHLEAAGRKWWVNYYPPDATTAPTNKDVAEWLVNERKLSKKMAEAIASMLRPDGLATGPRK